MQFLICGMWKNELDLFKLTFLWVGQVTVISWSRCIKHIYLKSCRHKAQRSVPELRRYLSWDRGVPMASKGLPMGVCFPRSTTAEAKFGQAPENGPRRFRRCLKWDVQVRLRLLSLFSFFPSTFCNSHSTENVFLNTLLMNDYGINLDEEMISHIAFQESVFGSWLQIKILLFC